jgi:uncharacterized protein (DUF4415 family)
MKMADSKKLTAEERAALKAIAAMPDEMIDTSDAPEVTDWTGAKRGMLCRPVKLLKSLRLDADVVAWFQRQGPGYQSRINAALREHVVRHQDHKPG